MVKITLIVICLIIGSTTGNYYMQPPKCTYNAQIKPCSCRLSDGAISWDCSDAKITFLGSDTFSKFSQNAHGYQKHIKEITISHTNIEEIPANIFIDLQFTTISMITNNQLKSIDSQAFINQDFRHFTLSGSPRLHHKSGHSTDGVDIFAIINKFKSLELLVLANINLYAIPANALKKLDHLKRILINDPKIKSIGERAFYSLKSLTSLKLFKIDVDKLDENVFTFTSNWLRLELDGNSPYLANKNIAKNALGNTGSDVQIQFTADNEKSWTTIDESIFRPFLTSPGKHALHIYGTTFDCNDARNAWLKSEPTLLKKVYVRLPHHDHFDEYKNPVACGRNDGVPQIAYLDPATLPQYYRNRPYGYGRG